MKIKPADGGLKHCAVASAPRTLRRSADSRKDGSKHKRSIYRPLDTSTRDSDWQRRWVKQAEYARDARRDVRGG